MPKPMPKVIDCSMDECAYNTNNLCHAMAINVEAEQTVDCAVCHSFTLYSRKAGVMDMTGAVGACKVDQCKFNDSLECTAPGGIHVGKHQAHPDCETFTT